MHQRVPPSWTSPGRDLDRPRLLIEDGDPALAVSDFSRFTEAGFDVALCPGPGSEPDECPMLHDEECPLLEHADVVLHGLSPSCGVADEIRWRHPEVPVVCRSEEPPAEGSWAGSATVVLPATAGVDAQIRALRHALRRRPV